MIDKASVTHYEHPADAKGILAWARQKLAPAGYPSQVVLRVTWHSARSGGATDLYRRGVDEHVIKRLDRWASDCVRTYMRLSVAAVHDWLVSCPEQEDVEMIRSLRTDNAALAARIQRRAKEAGKGPIEDFECDFDLDEYHGMTVNVQGG